MGEDKINTLFINYKFIKIKQKDYDKLSKIDKINNNYYIPQKKFKGLLGMGGGNLSYDFYLPQYKWLCEFQGIQHEKYTPGFQKSKKDFDKQLEHDKRKREYTQQNGYKLLEIWYKDFDNIETILKQELKQLFEKVS
jgi:very-short-patch-repair endonuclease